MSESQELDRNKAIDDLQKAFKAEGWNTLYTDGIVYALVPRESYDSGKAEKRAKKIISSIKYYYSWGLKPAASAEKDGKK